MITGSVLELGAIFVPVSLRHARPQMATEPISSSIKKIKILTWLGKRLPVFKWE
jgi:hypothetical protein